MKPPYAQDLETLRRALDRLAEIENCSSDQSDSWQSSDLRDEVAEARAALERLRRIVSPPADLASTSERALGRAFERMFSVDELRRLLRYSAPLAHARLPVGPVVPADFCAQAAVAVLSTKEAAFVLEQMKIERPRRADQVDEVARVIGVRPGGAS